LKRQEDLHSEASYKRLERGRFIWPSPADGVVAISAAQLAYMLDGIDWRNPRHTWRPELAG
jgi:transposase